MTTRDRILTAIAVVALLLLAAEMAESQTQLAPQQMRAAKAAVLTCTKPPTLPATVTNPDGTTVFKPGVDCASIVYIDLVTAAGTELKIIGVPATMTTINPPDWTVVP